MDLTDVILKRLAAKDYTLFHSSDIQIWAKPTKDIRSKNVTEMGALRS